MQTDLRNPYLCSLLSIVLLIVAWVIPNYPFAIFIAFVPLFYLIKDESYRSAIFVFIVFTVAIVISGRVDTGYEFILPILIALGFVLYSFTNHVLNSRMKLFVIVIFILGLEFFYIKFFACFDPFFLADAIPSSWSTWNLKTGYLGSSAWIIIANVVFYYILITKKKTNKLVLILVFLAIVAIPILLATSMDQHVVAKHDMLALYSRDFKLSPAYAKQGEVVARTCAWVSVLLLVFAVIKSKVEK